MTFILFGATGDLAKRKIIPALFHLMNNEKFIVVMTGYEESGVKEILEAAKKFIKGNIKPNKWERFIGLFRYFRLNIDDPHHFRMLDWIVNDFEKEKNLKRHRIAYCAVASTYFARITEYLVLIGTIRTGKGTWDRILYEKPFGKNLKDAQEINQEIEKWLEERQIFRVDHYLAKGFLNILDSYKCATTSDGIWNNKYIEGVTIYCAETIGIEGRSYYDGYGAISDMLQSHMLQLLALVAEKYTYGGQYKMYILNSLRLEHGFCGFLGQYESYKEEVGKDSQTETFFNLHFKIDSEQWKDVTFTLCSGKKLKDKETSITILGKDGMTLTFKDTFENDYSKLIFGNKRYCVTKEEIERQWQIVDDIKGRNLDLKIY